MGVERSLPARLLKSRNSAVITAQAGNPTRMPLRGFVPLEDVSQAIAPTSREPVPTISFADRISFVEAREAPTSLFGDAER